MCEYPHTSPCGGDAFVSGSHLRRYGPVRVILCAYCILKVKGAVIGIYVWCSDGGSSLLELTRCVESCSRGRKDC